MTPIPSQTRKTPRIWLAVFTAATSLSAVFIFTESAASDGWDVLDVGLILLFTILFTWVAFSFFAATLGFFVTLTEPVKPLLSSLHSPTRKEKPLPKTVLLVPVYNEDPTEVFAGLRATCESLRSARVTDSFDIFILSDTRDPRIWLQEELAWAALASKFSSMMGIFYRRRSVNEGKKAGNISEFCRRWGGQYKYMVIFDADSVMSGATIAELVRRMEQQPDVGIMQAPPLPVGRESLFARMQQFASSAYGDIYAAGLASWSQSDANYYGHNAIIRVDPFIKHCALRKLPGKPPLGGDILSHDFVEAALMRRAGWKVILADDLTGSYEQCPPTLIDFAKRDHRWCLGNLQHLRIVFRSGLHPVSRIHLLSGAMSYLSAPIWLTFMALGVTQEVCRHFGWLPGDPSAVLLDRTPVLILLAVTLGMLLLPKLMAWLVLERDELRLVGHGDHFEAFVSAGFETFIGMLIAPIMMIYHTQFVCATLIGHRVHWTAQQRGECGTTFREAASALRLHTLIGVLGMIFVAVYAPSLFWWLLPVGLGLVLAIPIAMILPSVELGRAFRRHNLFMIPDEQFESPILTRRTMAVQRIRARLERDGEADLIGRVVLVPEVHHLHLTVLRASAGAPDPAAPLAQSPSPEPPPEPKTPAELDALTNPQLMALLCDERAMRQLHHHAWTNWPLEEILRRSS